MKPETEKILLALREKFNNIPDAQGKEDFYTVVEALITLFVDEAPGLVDPKNAPNVKGALFVSALMGLGSQAMQMNQLQDQGVPDEDIPFVKKFEKFKHLMDMLNIYSA